MCGINGFITKDEKKIRAMNTALLHRGPDYGNIYVDEYISLGHTLLSIRDNFDVSGQPYTKKDSPWILLFNGQIYNTDAIKKDLGAQTEKIDLDTTLLFLTIEKYGWDFIHHIHGMFAIALYHRDEKSVRLYRDPSGQKLLYYYHKDDQFIFSSEIRGILTHDTIDRTVDEEAVIIATSLGYIPGKKTLFQYIHKLNLGEVIQFDLSTKKLTSKYLKSKALEYYPDNLEKAFDKLISEHLQSKQRVSVNLSGGLDSSLLVHEMSQVGYQINSYTNFFENCDEQFNRDALLARRLATEYKTNHTEILITKESYYNNFIDAYRLIEEPNYNITLPAYLQTATKEGILGDKNRVILSGDGGDEVFAGYGTYMQSKKIDWQIRLCTPFFFNIIKNRRNKTSYDFSNISERWLFFKRFSKSFLKNNSDSTSLLKKYIQETSKEFLDCYGKKNDFVQQMMCLDRVLWLGGENCIRSDKLYMSQSLELRSPLSYHPWRLYIDAKLTKKDYVSKDLNKLYLRKHYAGKLPAYIVDRKDKSGWRSPVSAWYDTQYKNLFLEIISAVEKNNALIDWSRVKKEIEKKESWPGKHIHVYLSLAILAKEYNLAI
jgi:asparagine synthase (glutamine-hydrolysing)